ncbi:MAG: class I SAM-dependent methyltransferase [Alphaproteobacteria bacterium]|jgi:ubiquinone/menaquinone biosynthesis C-methylase UbiE|nr:class I SAM-dependent methyltransferase [Alphaproteobacteria bacterium]MBT5389773.1 class I SAM-dependent methyltransferase [Alphaproteobacteria bacterium]MBT5540867.1 class I SAM-dependent methyltransferase [Alphaproteobacteria bacterium]
MVHKTEKHYQQEYLSLGMSAQRSYPNEELARFLGREFFKLSKEIRKTKRILEVGCGTGGNLWSISREGFDTYGLDLSQEAIKLCRKKLEEEGGVAELQVASMLELPYEDNFFDSIVDVFSGYCFPYKDYTSFITEVSRTLKPGGLFYSYVPSQGAHDYLISTDAERLDDCTLKENNNPEAIYRGQKYPFLFLTKSCVEKVLESVPELGITYFETVSKSYEFGSKKFEWLSYVLRKD